MRRLFTLGVVASLTLFMSLAPEARAQRATADNGLRWDILSDDERQIIDRLAADFYEKTLRLSQSNAIEDQTSALYRNASEEERARFRAARRENYQALSTRQREALRGVKTPTYRNLTEDQKTPFRRHAIDQLGAADAIDNDALAQALGGEI